MIASKLVQYLQAHSLYRCRTKSQDMVMILIIWFLRMMENPFLHKSVSGEVLTEGSILWTNRYWYRYRKNNCQELLLTNATPGYENNMQKLDFEKVRNSPPENKDIMNLTWLLVILGTEICYVTYFRHVRYFEIVWFQNLYHMFSWHKPVSLRINYVNKAA